MTCFKGMADWVVGTLAMMGLITIAMCILVAYPVVYFVFWCNGQESVAKDWYWGDGGAS